MKLLSFHNKTLSLEDLIDQCKNEDRKAQKALYERFAPVMLGLCRRYVKQIEIAEEMMSNGFIKAFRYIGQFENKGSFEGWLRKIMVRECLDHLRTEKNLIVSVDSFSPQIEPYEHATTHMEAEELLTLIDTLPNGYREIFNLYVIEGYKHHEIADLLKISENTSKTQLMKAKNAIQKKVTELEGLRV
ncbi:MAG: RNA polymerase sigma factor [Saprospiraceae bacterium]